MKWKRILSVLIVSVLVIGGLTVMAETSQAQDEGQLVQTINIQVTLEMETAIGDVYDENLDLFMQSVSGQTYAGVREEWRDALETWEVKGSYNNLFINPAHEGKGTPEIQDAVDQEWIEEPQDVNWLANDKNGEWTVNPFAHDTLRFAMQYINRQEIVEDLMDGYGSVRYAYMAKELQVWQERFADHFQEEYDISPQGDQEKVETLINEAMQEIKNDVAFGEVTGNMEDGWYYNHPNQEEHQIEIKILGRVEDWRQDLADHMANVLSGYGFDAWVEPVDSATAIPMAFFGQPEPYDNLDYHIYTGGWISTAAVYYTDAAGAQMYAPWYGFVQTYGPEGHWQYDDEGYDQRVQQLDDVSSKAFNGEMETEDEYWQLLQETASLGFEEAVRVFITTSQSVYPYNPDTLISAVPESVNGYDTYFGPRTMITADGTLDTAILTGEDRPYMDNWNIYGGSSDVYGEYERRMARSYGVWNNPQTGVPMQVNNYWMDQQEFEQKRPGRSYPHENFSDDGELKGEVTYDFEYTDEDGDGADELQEYIDVPTDAVDYIVSRVTDLNITWNDEEGMWTAQPIKEHVQEWKTAQWIMDNPEPMLTENQTLLTDPNATEDQLTEYMPQNPGLEDGQAAIEITIDVHESNTYHDGSDFSLRDVMHNYARGKRLGDDFAEPYYAAHADLNQGWWDAIHATQWNEQDGTYTIWGDYTFPVEPKAGMYYSIFSECQEFTYEGWDHLHGGQDTQFGVDTAYDYEGAGGANWIHQISPSHTADLRTTLTQMRDAAQNNDWVPAYLDADNNAPIAMSSSEAATRIQNAIDFIDTYNHAYIGMGPFVLDNYNTDDHSMTLQRFDDYGYPDDYWGDQIEVNDIVLESMDAPTDANTGEDVTVSVSAHYAMKYPKVADVALQEDHLRDYRIRLVDPNTGETVMTVGSDEIDLTTQDGYSLLETTISTEDMSGGNYNLIFEAAQPGDPQGAYTSSTSSVLTLYEAAGFNVAITNSPESVSTGEDVTIDYQVENTGGQEATQDIVFNVNGQEFDTEPAVTLGAGDMQEGNFTWDQTDDPGVHTLEVASEDTSDSVDVQVTTEGVYFDVSMDVSDDQVQVGDEITVDYTVTNVGDEEGTQTIAFNVDDSEEDTEDVTLGAGNETSGSFTWEASESGDFNLSVASDNDDASMSVTVEEEETPGFTLGLLVVGAVVAVAIYYKKEHY